MLILFAGVVSGQPVVEQGADVFAKTCASGYCHGTAGQGGGAPKLAGRGFDEAFIISTTRAGVAGTAMQGYGTVLARPDFNAVVAYVAKLNGIEPRAGDPVRTLSAEAAKGRELFSDPLRGFARCSSCHLVDGIGIAVAPIARVPDDAAKIATPHVVTASIGGETFPALIVSQGGRRASLYDLTSPPPVLRTVEAASLRVGKKSGWRHPTDTYRAAELAPIITFLRAVLP